MALEPCDPQAMPSNLCQQRSGSRAALVVGQETSVTGNAVYFFHCHHHCHYGCEHGWVGQLLPGTRKRYNALDLYCMPAPHHRAGAQGSPPDPSADMEQELFSQTILIESDNMATVLYINKHGGVVSKTLSNDACTLYKWVILDQSNSGQSNDQVSTTSWQTSCHTIIAQTPQSGTLAPR